MKWTKGFVLLIAAAAIAAALFIGYTLGRQGAAGRQAASQPAEEAREAAAKVKVAAAGEGVIEKAVTAFGTVVASPEDVQTISVPFDCRVRRVLALAGQAVEAEAKIIDIEPTPEALLALSDARTTQATAQRDLAQVQQRLEMKLATKTELSAAEQTLQLAQSKLESLAKRHIVPQTLTSGLAGLVSKVDVQEGQIVTAGGPLVEIVPVNRIQVRLGAEPSRAALVKPGQKVYIQTVQDDQHCTVEGEVKLVTQRVNPASRLVDVYVTVPASSPMMLETFVQARIVVESKKALVVPRSAVLPEEDKHILFIVRDGKAVECEVETGLEDDENIELTGQAVKAGDVVVVQGNAELEKDMGVDIEPAGKAASQAATEGATQAAATEPAASGSAAKAADNEGKP